MDEHLHQVNEHVEVIIGGASAIVLLLGGLIARLESLRKLIAGGLEPIIKPVAKREAKRAVVEHEKKLHPKGARK